MHDLQPAAGAMNDDIPEYIGGDAAPADLWGRAPRRFGACRIVEELIGADGPVPAYVVVDALIEAGLIENELGPSSP